MNAQFEKKSQIQPGVAIEDPILRGLKEQKATVTEKGIWVVAIEDPILRGLKETTRTTRRD